MLFTGLTLFRIDAARALTEFIPSQPVSRTEVTSSGWHRGIDSSAVVATLREVASPAIQDAATPASGKSQVSRTLSFW